METFGNSIDFPFNFIYYGLLEISNAYFQLQDKNNRCRYLNGDYSSLTCTFPLLLQPNNCASSFALNWSANKRDICNFLVVKFCKDFDRIKFFDFVVV